MASTQCPRCGLKVNNSPAFCPACGFSFSNRNQGKGAGNSSVTGSNNPLPGTPLLPGSNFPAPVGRRGRKISRRERLSPSPAAGPDGGESAAGEQTSGWGSFLGWRRLSGTVIAVEPPYMAAPEFNWIAFLLKILLIIFLVLIIGPIILGIILGLMAASLILSLVFPSTRGAGGGFVSGFFGHFINFFFIGRAFRRREVAVRDVRLRDRTGQEHLLRIRGDVITGNFNVGDEIEVEGPNRRGTLLFRRGWNRRIRSEIRVRRR